MAFKCFYFYLMNAVSTSGEKFLLLLVSDSLGETLSLSLESKISLGAGMRGFDLISVPFF